ncbi:MAG: cytochrome c [Phycisphaeraceae bacterium]
MSDQNQQPEAEPQPQAPDAIETMQQELADLRLPKPPFWMIAALIILVVHTWIPLALIARARVTKSTEPRVHIFQDMDVQPRYGPQASSPVFADGRSMRQPIEGTVARGELNEDDHYYRGYRSQRNADTGKWDVTYFEGMPAQVTVDDTFIRRGQERFNIYCAVCHGQDGYGAGPVTQRARDLKIELNATPMHNEAVLGRADGHLFNTITNGIRSMAGYGQQIAVEDRWAIVSYIRALQLSQNAPLDAVPVEKRGTLR